MLFSVGYWLSNRSVSCDLLYMILDGMFNQLEITYTLTLIVFFCFILYI